MSIDLVTSRATLIADIELAFKDVVWDGGITIQQARAIDDYLSEEEQLDARSRDLETRWQEIPEDKLRSFEDVLPFFCAKSYRFYIPAYMIWTLRHLDKDDEDSGLSQSTVFSFQLGRPSDPWYKSHLARFEALNVDQKRVVCKFLRHLRDACEFMCDAQEFLDDYWGKFCSA